MLWAVLGAEERGYRYVVPHDDDPVAACRHAWFYDDYWQHLPVHEIERIVREVALRGVLL
jgi:hypothetical protein